MLLPLTWLFFLKFYKLPKLAITKARPVDVALSPSENHVLENFVTHEKNTTPVNPINKNEIYRNSSQNDGDSDS